MTIYFLRSKNKIVPKRVDQLLNYGLMLLICPEVFLVLSFFNPQMIPT
jgi:hypothetical protein